MQPQLHALNWRNHIFQRIKRISQHARFEAETGQHERISLVTDEQSFIIEDPRVVCGDWDMLRVRGESIKKRLCKFDCAFLCDFMADIGNPILDSNVDFGMCKQ